MWKRFFATACACVIFLLLIGALRLQNTFPLSALTGERTYYLDSLSSQAVLKKRLRFSEIFRVKGQSVKLEGRVDVQEIASRYGATLVKTERLENVVSYYYFIDGKTGVCVDGTIVNLHIAVSKNQTVVGVPFIFGSF